jgi:hypothetical protein
LKSIERIKLMDFDIALSKVIKEPIPEKKCLQFAWLMRFSDSGKARALLSKALQAAAKSEDAYLAIYPLAWPIRALIEKDMLDLAVPVVKEAIAKSASIVPKSSRAQALFLLLQSVWEVPSLRDAVLSEYLRAAMPFEHWRVERNYIFAALMIGNYDLAQAWQMAENMDDSKAKRQLEKRLEARELCQPRPFFW